MYEIDEVGTGTPMNTAVRLGHHQVVEVLLKHCTKTKSHTNFYRAELVLAVTLLHADVVRVLLKHGVNVNTYVIFSRFFYHNDNLYLTEKTLRRCCKSPLASKLLFCCQTVDVDPYSLFVPAKVGCVHNTLQPVMKSKEL